MAGCFAPRPIFIIVKQIYLISTYTFIHLFNIFTKNKSYVNLIIVGLSTMLTSSHTFSRKLDERRRIAMIDKIIMLLLATSITIVALKLLIQS